MGSLACFFAVASLMCVNGNICLAEQPTGPATLESLLNSDEGQKPASAEADAGPKRPAGTVARPKGGVQHPDLDKAWADYDAAVTKAAEGIRAAISKQFDAATAKGDLDEAEKWQNAIERFEKAGELPVEKETKTAVSAAVANYKKAGEELAAAYEAVVKSLTMEKKIAEAKIVRNEFADIHAMPEESPADQSKEEYRAGQGRRRKWTLVLWNTHNGHWRDRGTKTCDITATFGGKTVFERKGLEVPWFRDRDANATVEILSPGIDSLRVSITAWNGPGSGGLAEIQLFDASGKNVAPTYQVESSEPGDRGVRMLIDGDTSAGGDSRWALPNGTLGWVEIRRPSAQQRK